MVGHGIYSKLRVFLLVISIATAIQAVFIVRSDIARALTWDMDWSWTNRPPDVIESTPVNSVGVDSCSSSYQIKEVEGEIDQQQICVNENNHVSFGIYFINGGTHQAVFKHGGENKFHKINDICWDFGTCIYLPDTDTLVTKQFLINNLVYSLVVYKNFQKRLSLDEDGPKDQITYNFNSSNPDYVFRDTSQPNGYAWPIEGYAASKNGKWLAMEVKGRGIELLNVETFEMKRISTMAFYYDRGYDATTELDVTNNGKHVVVMGKNAGITIYDVDSNCGDEATNNRMNEILPIDNPCKTIPIDYGGFIYRFDYASRPVFNLDGGELSFYAKSYVNEIRKVVLRVPGYFKPKLDYLALGDSFSSSEGESDDNHYVNGTNDRYEKCHLSIRSYPYLVSDMLGIDVNFMRSVACSGATTNDILGTNDNYWGQGNRLSVGGLNLDLWQKTSVQNDALVRSLPGRIRQISFVREYQPRVITVGIGGNDAGFMEKLKACLGPDTCSWADNNEDKEKTVVEIKNLFETLVQTYNDLHDASPYSKIYAIGYPKIISATGECDLTTGLLLNSKERQFMDEGIIYLNQVIEAAARKAGIKYIDVQNSFGDSVLCGSKTPSAMNAIRTGDDISPVTQADWFKVIGQESFHPNPLGHSYVANAIFESVGNILAYDYCLPGVVVCPQSNSAPEPSSYWGITEYHDYPLQRITNFILNPGEFDQPKHLKLSSGSLTADSDVRVEISSNSQIIGQFKTASDGSLDASVDLPTNLDDGYHTMHLYGTSVSGEAVDLYQIIRYVKPVAEIVDNAKNDETKPAKIIEPVERSNPSVNLSSIGEIKGLSTVKNQPSSNLDDNKTADNSNRVSEVIGCITTVISGVIIVIAIILITKRVRKTSGKK